MDYPFLKNVMFRLFKIDVYIVYKASFCREEYRQTPFPCLFCLKLKDGKISNF